MTRRRSIRHTGRSFSQITNANYKNAYGFLMGRLCLFSMRARSKETGEEFFGGGGIHQLGFVGCVINSRRNSGLDIFSVDKIMG